MRHEDSEYLAYAARSIEYVFEWTAAHGHINEGDRRTVWFDAANMPAICSLDASFFEPGTRQDERFWDVGLERLKAAAELEEGR